MAWLERFYPDIYLDSAYEIDYEALYRQGFRGVIFDIDNTLVPHGAPADARSITLFERLHNIGLDSVLLSNNKEPRVKMFNDKVHSRYIYKAGKPAVKSYHKAMEMMGTDAATTFLSGISFLRMCGERKRRESERILSGRFILGKRYRLY